MGNSSGSRMCPSSSVCYGDSGIAEKDVNALKDSRDN